MFARPRSAAVTVALLLAALAAIAAPASASPVKATIRVEGLAGPVIPTTTLSTDARPITSVDGVAHDLTVPSALTLAADAAQAAGLSLTCSWSDPFNDCFVSGFPTPFPLLSTDYWRLVLNGRDASAGFAGTAVHDGDRVDVIATDYTAAAEPPLLLIAPSVANVPDGTSFTVKVLSVDTTGATPNQPAVGALVSYGDLQGLADANGSISFQGTGSGFSTVSASLAGATSSQLASVCAYGADPTVCQLPAPATPAAPAATATTPATASGTSTGTIVATASAGAVDRIAPSSHFTAPLTFAKLKQVKRLVGVVAPDRSDIASVSYALARRVGTLCSFRRASGSLAPATSCTKPIWLPATGRAFWHVTFTKPLAAGRWRAFSRATDGAGNVESAFESQTSFIVAP
jgi:hypothetical protein